MSGKKMAVDLMLTVVILVLLNPVLGGFAVHEILGLSIGLGIVIHLVLNATWIRAMTRVESLVRLKPKARVNLILNIGLGFMFLLTIISGVLESQVVFPGLLPETADLSLISVIHHVTAYQSALMVLLHLVLHRQQVAGFIRRLVSGKRPVARVLTRVGALVLAVVGAVSLVKPITDLMLGQTMANSGDATSGSSQPVLEPILADSSPQVNAGTDIIGTESTQKEAVETASPTIAPTSETTPVVTLQEFLSKMTCSGCGKRCPLTALRCSKGQQYRDRAIQQYQTQYGSGADAGTSGVMFSYKDQVIKLEMPT